MQKNVAGQKIGAQVITAADGSAFTGAVTAYVTLDAGTQAVGTVGSGACTHEGNGYHTYAPSQAETNGTVAAFTFIGTGAVPATVQVFTTGYDPTAALTAFADALLSRDVDNVEASAADHTLCTAILKAVSRTRNNAGTLEIYRTDGTTPHATQTLTTDAAAQPIKEIAAAS